MVDRGRYVERSDRRKESDAALAAARLGRLFDPHHPLPSINLNPSRITDVVAIVAERLNFDQRPVTLDPGESLLDQARRALEASQVRTRQLTLPDGWWTTNVPSMVVEYHDQLAAVLPGPLFAPVLYLPDTDPVKITAAVAAEISPRALEVIPPLADRGVSLGELLRLSFAGTKRDLWIAVLSALAVGILSLAIPSATSFVFGYVVPHGSEQRLVAVVITLIGLAVAGACFAYTCSYHVVRIGDSVETLSTGSLVDRVLRMPASALRQWPTAELSARILVASSIQDALTQGITVGLMSVVVAVLNGFLMLYLVPALGVIALIAGVGLVVAKFFLMRRENRLMGEQLERQDVVEDLNLGLMRGWVPVRLVDGEVAGFGRWAAAFTTFRQAFNRRWGVDILSGVLTYAVLSFATVVFILVAYALPAGSISSSSFLAFTSAFGAFGVAITGIIVTMGAFARVLPSVDRLRPLLSVAPEVEIRREDPGPLRGEVEVRRLSFRYDEDSPWVLRDVSFRAPAGSFVGVVGTSGSGKSTLLRVLLGFEHPRGGAVLYDGSDLGSLDLGAVRRQFGVVLQSSLLLPGTLRENVTVSSGPLPDDQIWAMLDQVSAGDAIRAMPLGLDTVVDEGATILSGGQRQRVLLARALVHTPAVLFLDEATSALDNVTQEAVTRNVSTLGITRIVIAHRLSTIRHADQIIVLDEGVVAEQGTYDELMAADGLFASLVERQEL